MQILMVGLGNPGNTYNNTRHNAGFMCLDQIAQDHDFPAFVSRNSIMATQGKILDHNIVLVKPLVYMNNSGNILPDIIKKLHTDKIIVVHDDIYLKLGEIRIKFAGGNAGHNGLKSIDAHIGKNYWRIRIGIGRPENINISVSDFVLGKFSKEELVIINKKNVEISKNIIEYLDKESS